MEYQKTIDLLENTPNQPSEFRTKRWVEANDESHGTYNVNSQTKFKTDQVQGQVYGIIVMHIYLWVQL